LHSNAHIVFLQFYCFVRPSYQRVYTRMAALLTLFFGEEQGCNCS